MNQSKTRILIYDLETSPNLGAFFELYKEGNIVWTRDHWHILSVAWKWLGEKQTYVKSLPDFKTYKKDRENDIELVKLLWKLFDEADIIIAHNGNSFDQKKSNARFIFHKLPPPKPYSQIDTKLIAKRYFKFDSNKLDDLGDYLKIGRKLNTGGYALWKGCMENDKNSWKKMCEYNKQDVILLEKVYYALRGWDNAHPNLNLITGETHCCPNCQSKNTRKRGFNRSKIGVRQSHQCLNCGRYSSGEVIKIDKQTLR